MLKTQQERTLLTFAPACCCFKFYKLHINSRLHIKDGASRK